MVSAPVPISVWAPRASRVELVTGGGRRAMDPTGTSGWFGLAGPGLEPGQDYAFSLDGGTPRPDPRSRWQPHGVHGPSRVVEGAFAWTDGDWQGRELDGGSVVYELHVGTFSEAGTFDGVAEHLDHLESLGVTHVELMPVAEFDGGHGWGYDGVHLWAVRDGYGGPDGLRRLVDECHRRGLGVILDVVYNHLGPSGNYLREFGPYFTDRYHTPWGEAVNFDGPGSDQVRAWVVGNARAWLADYHLDGLRLDAIHAILDTSATHILEDLAAAADGLEAETGRRSFLVAESDLNDPRILRPVEVGGYGVHASWCDDLHHGLHALLTGERTGYYADFGDLDHVAKALTQGYVYDGQYSRFRDRRHGRRPTGVPARQLVCYAQTHDQVGNRARGERLEHLVGPDRARLAAALAVLGPAVPLIFQGEEWAASTPFQYFTDHPDADLGRAVSEGRRREFAAFGWDPTHVPDPQDRATFERSRLRRDETDRPHHRAMLDWYRRLIALRRGTGELSDGQFGSASVEVDHDRRVLRLHRGPVTVTANLGAEAVEVEGRVLISSGLAWPDPDSPAQLEPDGVAVTSRR